MRGYRVHRAPLDFELASTAFSARAFSHFARLAREADVVHYHFPWPFSDLVHLMARSGKPSVVTYHSDIIRQKHLLRLYRPLQQRFLSSVDSIVATSPNYLATSTVLQEFAHKVSVIPIGLDRSTYPQPDPQRLAQWRARVGGKFFLFIGMLRYYKGLHVLLEAAQGLEYPIVIAGAGEIEAALRAQAARLGLRNVHFPGPSVRGRQGGAADTLPWRCVSLAFALGSLRCFPAGRGDVRQTDDFERNRHRDYFRQSCRPYRYGGSARAGGGAARSHVLPVAAPGRGGAHGGARAMALSAPVYG